MTREQALDLFNQATVSAHTLRDIDCCPSTWPSRCVENIVQASKMTERLGGELKSRQVIAAIIVTTTSEPA